MSLPNLDHHLDEYRERRMNGRPKERARGILFARLTWTNLSSDVLAAKPEIEKRLEQIEDEVARESGEGVSPDPAA